MEYGAPQDQKQNETVSEDTPPHKTSSQILKSCCPGGDDQRRTRREYAARPPIFAIVHPWYEMAGRATAFLSAAEKRRGLWRRRSAMKGFQGVVAHVTGGGQPDM